MIICGKNAIVESLRNKKAVFKLYVSKNLMQERNNEIFRLAKQNNVQVIFKNKEFLDKITKNAHHQGFVAEVENFTYSTTDDILNLARERGEQPFIVILDKVEDPHNLGSVIRVCECAGVHGIIIPKHSACEVNQTVASTSAGAYSYCLVARVTNINQEIERLKKEGVWVYGIELGGEPLYSENLTGAIALVIGSEGFGTSALVKKNCDKILTIPMRGKINSLNASVACGVAVFEVLRQRGANEQ